MNNDKILDISWGMILKISLVAICFYVFYLIKEILVWLIFALIISILFNPAIDFLQKKKIPRVLGTIFIYFGIFGILAFLIYSIAPLFVQEIGRLAQAFPQYFEKIIPLLGAIGVEEFKTIECFIVFLEEILIYKAADILAILFVVFGGIFAFLFIITIAIFLSLEEKMSERTIQLIFPKKYEIYALTLWEKCQKQVSGWFGARVLGCFFVGVASYIALQILGIEYSFILALFAGFLNFIPVIGPLFTGFLLFFIIFFDSLLKAIFVVVAYFLIQQIENNMLTPILTRKFIGLPPVLVLISLAIGGALQGVLGAFLAIPIAGILFEFLRNFLKKRKEESVEMF